MFYNNNLMLLIALPLSSSYLLLSTLLKHTQYLKVGMSKKNKTFLPLTILKCQTNVIY